MFTLASILSLAALIISFLIFLSLLKSPSHIEILLAIESSKMNGLKNIYFEKDDINNISKLDLLRKYGKPNVIILYPPRQGLTKKIIKVLLEIKSEKILYISCNPSTQARDLEILSCEYEVTLSQAIDMFPQTSHVENIVLLTNK